VVDGGGKERSGIWNRFNQGFNRRFQAFLGRFDRVQGVALARPVTTVLTILGICGISLSLWPELGFAYFPRTDPGQFVINLKAPAGTRVEISEQEVAKVEAIVRRIVAPKDLRLIVSNIGSTPDLSSIYTSNSAPHTAYVQVSLNDDHQVGSYEYMDDVRRSLQTELPELTAYFQSGGLVDAILNQGLAAPIDIQVSGNNLESAFRTAAGIRNRVSKIPGVADTFIPQDVDAPALELQVDRYHAKEMGLDQKEVISNVITALTSDGMIAPSYWVDPKSGNLYMLSVQFPNSAVKSLSDLKAIPIRSASQSNTTLLDTVTRLKQIKAPTEVDHYKLRRVIDVYVSTRGEELSRVAAAVNRVVDQIDKPAGIVVHARGIVGAMNSSLQSFGFGLLLSLLLVYLILVAQFRSFVDPFLILLAVPPGIAGVLLILTITGTTLNIMSLMGLVMMVGIVVSNSILIVEFTHRLVEEGMDLRKAVQHAVRVRLRPILMTSLATIMGLIPMALEPGANAPLARSIIGGLVASVVLTVFIVPSAVLIIHRRRHRKQASSAAQPAESY
jgi:HAE1 family hydrophobic/amphiphilic exporter-1